MRIVNGKLTMSMEELAPNRKEALKSALLESCNKFVAVAKSEIYDGATMLQLADAELIITRKVNECLNGNFVFPVTDQFVEPSIIYPYMEGYVKEHIKVLQNITDSMCAKGEAVQMIAALIAGVSPKDGRLVGIFTKMSPSIPISLPFIQYSGVSGEELACILAHEIGHFYDFAELFARGLRDLTLADTLTRGIRAASGAEQVEQLLRTAERVFGVTFSDTNELITLGDNKTLSLTILRDLGLTKQLSSRENTWRREINADNFAGDIFGPVAMAKALAKLAKVMVHGANDSSSSFYYHLVHLAPLWTPLFALGAIPVLGWLGGGAVSAGVIGTYLAAAYSQAKPNVTHPDIAERFKLLRSGLIMRTRGKTLTAAQLKNINKDIEILDEMIKCYDFKKFPIMGAIVGFFNPKDRKVVKARELDVTLTQLSNNRLWVQAQQLKQF